MNDTWQHKDMWKREGRKFLVQVSRHSASSVDLGDGENRWCVYAYIYPGHPYFDRFDVDGPMFQDAACALPLHAGPSFFRAHFDHKEKKYTSVQVGADYNHLHDSRFGHMATRADAYEVFQDADALFDWLTHQTATPSPAQADKG